MPYLKIQTNLDIPSEQKQAVLQRASALTADWLKKPESYVMTVFEGGLTMTFGGSPEPVVFMELKSIGLPESRTGGLARKLCDFIEEVLKVSRERTYIEFADASGEMWGWKGGTFA